MDILSFCCDAPSEQTDVDDYECSECLKSCESYAVHRCRGEECTSVETSEFTDWYGITTGHWCDSCYESNYPYRKDRYPSLEMDGYGERIEDDY